MTSPLPEGVFFQRLAIATALGFAIGLERQWRQRSTGLHTSTVVAVGAALFTAMPELYGSTDIMRTAANVVTGVGFLAGGVILRDGFNVRGLVTASTLWATAAVGVMAGVGLPREAAVGAAVIIAANIICMPLADLIARIPHSAGELFSTDYTLRIGCAASAREAVQDRIVLETRSTSLRLSSVTNSAVENGAIEIVAAMTRTGRDHGAAERLLAALSALDGVTSTNWEAVERAT